MVPWSLSMPSVRWRMVLEMDDFVETTQLCGNILRFYAEAPKIYGADRTHSWRWDGGRRVGYGRQKLQGHFAKSRESGNSGRKFCPK